LNSVIPLVIPPTVAQLFGDLLLRLDCRLHVSLCLLIFQQVVSHAQTSQVLITSAHRFLVLKVLEHCHSVVQYLQSLVRVKLKGLFTECEDLGDLVERDVELVHLLIPVLVPRHKIDLEVEVAPLVVLLLLHVGDVHLDLACERDDRFCQSDRHPVHQHCAAHDVNHRRHYEVEQPEQKHFVLDRQR